MLSVKISVIALVCGSKLQFCFLVFWCHRSVISFCFLVMNLSNYGVILNWNSWLLEQSYQLMQTFLLFCIKKKNYFLFIYFIHQFLQNTHISLSILHIYSIKYSFFYNFIIIFSLTTPLSHKPYTTKNIKILNAWTTITIHL